MTMQGLLLSVEIAYDYSPTFKKRAIRKQCGKVYVGDTQRRLEARVKEHRDACNKGDVGKSAIAEHQWDQQHQVNWEGTRVLDRASRPV